MATMIKREIKNPYWTSDLKNQVVCEFHYHMDDGSVSSYEATVTKTDEGNPDWIEIIEKFAVEQIDELTSTRLAKRKERQDQKAAEEIKKAETLKQEALFAAKLEAFEIPEIRASKERTLKARIRKATTMMEIHTFATILVMKELEKAANAVAEESTTE
jgi:hypothetical protein